jgi:hypothetical protein
VLGEIISLNLCGNPFIAPLPPAVARRLVFSGLLTKNYSIVPKISHGNTINIWPKITQIVSTMDSHGLVFSLAIGVKMVFRLVSENAKKFLP